MLVNLAEELAEHVIEINDPVGIGAVSLPGRVVQAGVGADQNILNMPYVRRMYAGIAHLGARQLEGDTKAHRGYAARQTSISR